VLSIDKLELRYPNGTGVGPVSLEVPDGSVYAIIGPNGAGKTTLFSVLSGIANPTGGTWRLGSADPATLPRRDVGYLPEKSFFFPRFTPRQFFSFDATMRDIDHVPESVRRDLVAFGCEPFLDEEMGELSQGMAKRVALACAFSGSPRLVLLDEPLNAIDIQTTILLKAKVVEAAERGAVVLISSHILDFVDKVADEVIFLNHGLLDSSIDPKARGTEEEYRKRFID
jgi:ABC-2 type transport system ATP-binding protein